MVRLRLIHSVPASSAPPHVCTVDLDSGATRVTALLDAARLVPRQPEGVRDRAIGRARAALATEVVFTAPAIRRRGLRVSVTIITCAAFAIGAAGAAAALHGRPHSRLTAPGAVASTPPAELAEAEPANFGAAGLGGPPPNGQAQAAAAIRNCAPPLRRRNRLPSACSGGVRGPRLHGRARCLRGACAPFSERLAGRRAGGSPVRDRSGAPAVATSAPRRGRVRRAFPASALSSRLQDTTGTD